MSGKKPIWVPLYNMSYVRRTMRENYNTGLNAGMYALAYSEKGKSPKGYAYDMKECLYIGQSNALTERLGDHLKRFKVANHNRWHLKEYKNQVGRQIEKEWNTKSFQKYFFPEDKDYYITDVWVQLVLPPTGLQWAAASVFPLKMEAEYLFKYAKNFNQHPIGNQLSFAKVMPWN